MFFEARPDEGEVTPGGVGVKTTRHNLPGMIIGRQNKRLREGSGPPLMGRGIVLEEFPNGGGFPAAARFGTRSQLGYQQRVMLLHMLGHRRAGANKGKAAAELIREKGVIERSGERKNLAQE